MVQGNWNLTEYLKLNKHLIADDALYEQLQEEMAISAARKEILDKIYELTDEVRELEDTDKDRISAVGKIYELVEEEV